MKVSLVQMNTVADKAANVAQARRLIDEAVAADRPDLVLLPELFTFLGGSLADKHAAAEPVPGGDVCRMLADRAVTHGITLHAGSMYEKDGGSHYNTTIVFGPDGRQLAKYRKIHLFDIDTPDGTTYRESSSVSRGADVVTYQANGVTVGCTTCYDIRFGELYRALAAKGAQLITIPAAFTLQTGKDHWEVLVRARAIETQCYVLACGQWGFHPEGNERRASWGHSMVVDPWGHIVAQAHDKVGFVSARLDLGYLESIRGKLPVARHHVLP